MLIDKLIGMTHSNITKEELRYALVINTWVTKFCKLRSLKHLKDLLSHRLKMSRILMCLNWVLSLAQCLLQDYSQNIEWGCSHLKIELGEDLLPNSLKWL